MVSVTHLAQLAHIALSDEEQETLQADLDAILSFISQIKNYNLDDAPALSDPYNVLREDAVHDFAHPDQLRQAFPQREGDYMKITKVIKHEK